MKKLLLIIAVAFHATLFAQENGFLFTSDNAEGTCAIETDDNCYIVCADQAWMNYWEDKPASLFKLSAEGILLKTVRLGDSFSQVVCLHKEAGMDVLYAVGLRWDTETEQMYPFVASFDKDLNNISINDVTGIPVAYSYLINDAAAVINSNGKVLFVLCDFFTFSLHYMILDLEGNLERFKEVQPSSINLVGSLCLLRDGSGDFGHYCSCGSIQMLRINEQLDIEPVFDIYQIQESQWNSSDTIYHVNVDPSPYPTVLPLTDSTFLFAEETLEYWTAPNHPQPFFSDNNPVFFKSTIDGDITNSLILDTRNDTLERPAYFQAIDNANPEAVYLCFFQHRLHNSFGPEIAPNHIILLKTNTDLNPIWERRYCMGDAFHLPAYILSTSDGGCLVTGYIHEEETRNMFVLKLNADGTLGTSNHVVREIPYRFYPNPVSDRLNIHYSPDVTPKAVELYDVQGRLIHTQHNNLENIGMENLPAGNYTLRVVMHDGNTYSEKVVKL